MKKIKTSILALLLFAASIQTGYASWEALPPEQKEYMLKMDDMTFKQLRDLALVNKASKAQVVEYFQKRLERLKKTQCPVLTKEWISANAGKQFPVGRISFFSEKRPRLTLFLNYTRITNINGVNWEVIIHQKTETMTNMFQNMFNGEDFKDVSELKSTTQGMSRLQLQGHGPIVQKKCKYTHGGYVIYLSVYDEFLSLDELGLNEIKIDNTPFPFE